MTCGVGVSIHSLKLSKQTYEAMLKLAFPSYLGADGFKARLY